MHIDQSFPLMQRLSEDCNKQKSLNTQDALFLINCSWPAYLTLYTGCFLKTCFFQELTALVKPTWRVKISILHIYILWHFRIWLVFTRFCCFCIFKRYSIGLHFSEHSIRQKEDIAYRLVNSGITTFLLLLPDPFWAAWLSFGISTMNLLTQFPDLFMYI